MTITNKAMNELRAFIEEFSITLNSRFELALEGVGKSGAKVTHEDFKFLVDHDKEIINILHLRNTVAAAIDQAYIDLMELKETITSYPTMSELRRIERLLSKCFFEINHPKVD